MAADSTGRRRGSVPAHGIPVRHAGRMAEVWRARSAGRPTPDPDHDGVCRAPPRTSRARQRRYLIAMGIRTLCFLVVACSRSRTSARAGCRGSSSPAPSPCPYVAVVMANAGRHEIGRFRAPRRSIAGQTAASRARIPNEFVTLVRGWTRDIARATIAARVRRVPRARRHRRVPESFPRGCLALVVIWGPAAQPPMADIGRSGCRKRRVVDAVARAAWPPSRPPSGRRARSSSAPRAQRSRAGRTPRGRTGSCGPGRRRSAAPGRSRRRTAGSPRRSRPTVRRAAVDQEQLGRRAPPRLARPGSG